MMKTELKKCDLIHRKTDRILICSALSSASDFQILRIIRLRAFSEKNWIQRERDYPHCDLI